MRGLPNNRALFFKPALTCLLVLIAGLAFSQADSTNWKPAAGPLMTRWAAEVNPTNALPEYPRPQLVRTQWLNLNGLWDYAIAPTTSDEPSRTDGRILVPFPIESALSGVMKHLSEDDTLWYRRTFHVPKEWFGKRVRLHFGAVDWQARVLVNGTEVGRHRGGYDGFSFDITDELHWTSVEEITVVVQDPTESNQPRGKQSRNPEGIFYTPTSGIWQTVWLEPVPYVCIDRLTFTPELDAQLLRLKVAANGSSDALRVEAEAFADGKPVGRVEGLANTELRLPLASPHLWSPEDPFLYDLRVVLKQGGNVVDSVTSYFGMRKIALQRDDRGFARIALNGTILFQNGALDQGFWPDGIYTAPTDEALRYDIQVPSRAADSIWRANTSRWSRIAGTIGAINWGCWFGRTCPAETTLLPESGFNLRRSCSAWWKAAEIILRLWFGFCSTKAGGNTTQNDWSRG